MKPVDVKSNMYFDFGKKKKKDKDPKLRLLTM